ncbi:MAG: sigma-70 family RNA polymerase sigma factor [Planctomycetota bacterium]
MDRKEFEDRALEYLDAVYRMALQLARHPDEASDLVQETYLKALKASANFEEQGGGIRPWLFKILHNVFYSWAARQKRGPISIDAFHDQAGSESLPDEPPPAWNPATLDWEHVDQRLKTAIEGLSTEYREVLLLWGVEGLKYRQIAHILDVPIGTVMSRLHRARGILMRELGPVAEELGFALDADEDRDEDGGTSASASAAASAATATSTAASAGTPGGSSGESGSASTTVSSARSVRRSRRSRGNTGDGSDDEKSG